jgi:hypothetical protein
MYELYGIIHVYYGRDSSKKKFYCEITMMLRGFLDLIIQKTYENCNPQKYKDSNLYTWTCDMLLDWHIIQTPS